MKTIIQIFCGLVLLLGWSNGAAAQNFRETTNNGLYAGFYLTVPLGGSERRGFSEKLNYGFAAGPSFEMRGASTEMTGRPMLRANVIDLNFSGRGFERFSLLGTRLLGHHRFDLVLAVQESEEGEDDGEKRSATDTFFMGAGVVFFALLAYTQAKD